MAVREGQDRRVGGSPEKLLTLEEAARRLEVPADDVEVLVRSGKLVSFRLGGSLLRVRLVDVEALRRQREKERTPLRAAQGPAKDALSVPTPAPRWERVVDFFYFNDFYFVAILIILTLLAIILAL